MQKKCSHYEDCKQENINIGEDWAFECPSLARKKDAAFDQCTRYENWERYHVPNSRGVAEKSPEQV